MPLIAPQSLLEIRVFLLEWNLTNVVWVTKVLIIMDLLSNMREFILRKNHTNIENLDKVLTMIQNLLSIGEFMCPLKGHNENMNNLKTFTISQASFNIREFILKTSATDVSNSKSLTLIHTYLTSYACWRKAKKIKNVEKL